MKFSLQYVARGGCRLGVIKDIPKRKDMTIETPFCILYTRAGSVPSLSIDLLKHIQDLPLISLLSLDLIVENYVSLREFQMGFASYSSMKDQIVCCITHDPATPTPIGYNEKQGVAVWGRAGKTLMNLEAFLALQEAIQPDWFVCLADTDISKESTKKRVKRAMTNSLSFLDKVLDEKKTSAWMKSVSIFGSIGLYFDRDDCHYMAGEVSSRPVDGFSVEGVQCVGGEFDSVQFADHLAVTLEHLPAGKPRMMNGVLNPSAVLRAVRAGVDIFDCSYVYTMTEKNQALIFKYDVADDIRVTKPENDVRALDGFTIDMADKRHNIHHYLGFFKAIRKAVKNNSFTNLETLVHQQNTANITCSAD